MEEEEPGWRRIAGVDRERGRQTEALGCFAGWRLSCRDGSPDNNVFRGDIIRLCPDSLLPLFTLESSPTSLLGERERERQ